MVPTHPPVVHGAPSCGGEGPEIGHSPLYVVGAIQDTTPRLRGGQCFLCAVEVGPGHVSPEDTVEGDPGRRAPCVGEEPPGHSCSGRETPWDTAHLQRTCVPPHVEYVDRPTKARFTNNATTQRALCDV